MSLLVLVGDCGGRLANGCVENSMSAVTDVSVAIERRGGVSARWTKVMTSTIRATLDPVAASGGSEGRTSVDGVVGDVPSRVFGVTGSSYADALCSTCLSTPTPAGGVGDVTPPAATITPPPSLLDLLSPSTPSPSLTLPLLPPPSTSNLSLHHCLEYLSTLTSSTSNATSNLTATYTFASAASSHTYSWCNLTSHSLAGIDAGRPDGSEEEGRGGGRGGVVEEVEVDEAFLFDRGDVRGALIALYTIVFISGFIGNLVVLVVMWLHPRMRSTTNFFLTNLAIADFCVTVFCVYQNMSQYLASTWVFGDFLCKMYNFVHYLSYTASVMILVVNCVERYVAIMCPFRAKTILRHRNLVVALVVVWVGSCVYCCPRLLFFRAGSHELPGAQYTEVICLADREIYDSRTFDTINFVLLYCMPLTVMSLLYWRIGSYLWITSRQFETSRWQQGGPHTPSKTWKNSTVSASPHDAAPSPRVPHGRTFCCISGSSQLKEQEDVHVASGLHHSEVSNTSQSRCSVKSWRKGLGQDPKPPESGLGPYHSERLIRTWRKVVKLLVAVVTCFAVCNLPFHLRKMLTYYHPRYNATTDAALLFTPISYLLMYLNSALNPIVYSFMSHNFRACVRDVLTRYTRKGRRRHPSGPRPPPQHEITVPPQHEAAVPSQRGEPVPHEVSVIVPQHEIVVPHHVNASHHLGVVVTPQLELNASHHPEVPAPPNSGVQAHQEGTKLPHQEVTVPPRHHVPASPINISPTSQQRQSPAPPHHVSPTPPHHDSPTPPHHDSPTPPHHDSPTPPHHDSPTPPHHDLSIPPHHDSPTPPHHETTPTLSNHEVVGIETPQEASEVAQGKRKEPPRHVSRTSPDDVHAKEVEPAHVKSKVDIREVSSFRPTVLL